MGRLAAILLMAVAPVFGATDILVLYDNTAARADVQADWGFAALVTAGGEKVLFDTGTKPDILLANMKALAVDPAAIGRVVISHAHNDHLGGLPRILPSNPAMKVFFLDAFPPPVFRTFEQMGTAAVHVKGPTQIAPGVRTTGVVEGMPPEQALVIRTAKGAVIITGCSHPGVVRMVEAAGEKPVRLLVGGFHMLNHSEAQTGEVIARLKALGVESISATHCTGDAAIKLFEKAWGEKFVAAGVGKRFTLD